VKNAFTVLRLLLLAPFALLAQASETWQTDPDFWNGYWTVKQGSTDPWSTRPVKGEDIFFQYCAVEGGRIKGRMKWREGTRWLAAGKMELDPQTATLRLISDNNHEFDVQEGVVLWVKKINKFYTDMAVVDGVDTLLFEKYADKGTMVDFAWPELKFTTPADSLVGDTASARFQSLLRAGRVSRIVIRAVVSRYDWLEGQGYRLLPGSDTTLALDTTFNPVHDFWGDLEPESSVFNFALPGLPQGSVVEFQMAFWSESESPWLFGPSQYRVYPMRGKAGPSLTPVNVSDIMRLVYVILGWVPPSTADYLGLELDGSGTFSDEDIGPLLELWRRSTVDK